MIYDHKGEELNRIFDESGNRISSAYDSKGNLIYTDEYNLIVMSYNVQWWTKRNSNITMQKEIFSKYNADLIGLQEFSKTSSLPSEASQSLMGYPYKYISNHYNFNAIASKKALSDVTDTDFTYEDDEKWAYQKGYFPLYGKQIAFFNTHFTWRSDDATIAGRGEQALELLEAMNEEEYVIATGDFNVGTLTYDSTDYINTFKPFVDAGYKMANFTPETGITKTYTNLSDPQSLDDFRSAPDNIIVSPNIDIIRTVFDTTKLDYPDGNYIDHIPVISYLKVN